MEREMVKLCGNGKVSFDFEGILKYYAEAK
jgi:hypothetical protein